MKTNIKVFTSTGELTTLGRELGKGGEGAVYDIEEFVDSVAGNDSNLLIVFYVQIMPDDFVMQLHRF